MFCCGAQGKEQSIQINGQYTTPFVRIQLIKITPGATGTCVGEAGINTAKYLQGLGKCIHHRIFFDDIDGHCMDLGAIHFQFRKRLLDFLLVTTPNTDVAALFGNTSRKAQADATVATGDQCGLVAQVE